jgi:hypothetical protein
VTGSLGIDTFHSDRFDFWVRTDDGSEHRFDFNYIETFRDGHEVSVVYATRIDTGVSVVLAIVNHTAGLVITVTSADQALRELGISPTRSRRLAARRRKRSSPYLIPLSVLGVLSLVVGVIVFAIGQIIAEGNEETKAAKAGVALLIGGLFGFIGIVCLIFVAADLSDSSPRAEFMTEYIGEEFAEEIRRYIRPLKKVGPFPGAGPKP